MLLTTILATSFLSLTALAQTSIIPSSEPSCIQSCTLFSQAQQACAPDVGNTAQYQSCFCQSAYLSAIKTTPSNNICPNCAAADWTTIASWYNGLCGGSGAAAAGGGNAQTTFTTVTTNIATAGGGGASTTSTSSSSSSAATFDSSLSSTDNPANWTDSASWFRTHWQWVVMIIVLAVAFTAIGVVGTIIHKRKSRSKQIGTNNTAPMTSNQAVNTWAPSRHSVHDFGTPRESSPAPAMPAMVAGSRRESKRIGKSPSNRN